MRFKPESELFCSLANAIVKTQELHARDKRLRCGKADDCPCVLSFLRLIEKKGGEFGALHGPGPFRLAANPDPSHGFSMRRHSQQLRTCLGSLTEIRNHRVMVGQTLCELVSLQGVSNDDLQLGARSQ
jgi:hypothetical protein